MKGRLWKLGLCLTLCLAALCVTAAAVNVQVEGDTMTVTGLSSDVKTVSVAGYNDQGQMLFIRTGMVSQSEAVIDLGGNSAYHYKVFGVADGWKPVETPVELETATRVWMAQKLCTFWDLDTTAFDTAPYIFNDGADLSTAEKSAILAVAEREVMNGYDDDGFHPADTLTRAQAAKLVVTAAGLDVPKDGTTGYTDVQSDYWFAPYVRVLCDKGILPNQGEFGPDRTVTQAEIDHWLALLTTDLTTLKAGTSVSNLRFEMNTTDAAAPAGVLAWDYTQPVSVDQGFQYEPAFQVYARKTDGSWFQVCQTDNTSVPMLLDPGDYTAFRVVMTTENWPRVPLAMKQANLALKVKQGGMDEDYSGTLHVVSKGEDRYDIYADGLNDYGAVQLFRHCWGDTDGNLLLTASNGTAFNFDNWWDERGQMPYSDYELYGAKGYDLKSSTSMECTVYVLKDYQEIQIDRSGMTLSNVRFDQVNGVPVIAWDCSEGSGIYYQVFVQPSGGGDWVDIGGTNGRHYLPVFAPAGTWKGVAVEAKDTRTFDFITDAENPNLIIKATDRGTSSIQPFAWITDQWDDGFDFRLRGMTGFTTYSVDFSANSSFNDCRGCFDILNGDGTSSGDYLEGSPETWFPPNGYCRIQGGKDYWLNGNTLSYYIYTLRDWSNTSFPLPSGG